MTQKNMRIADKEHLRMAQAAKDNRRTVLMICAAFLAGGAAVFGADFIQNKTEDANNDVIQKGLSDRAIKALSAEGRAIDAPIPPFAKTDKCPKDLILGAVVATHAFGQAAGAKDTQICTALDDSRVILKHSDCHTESCFKAAAPW